MLEYVCRDASSLRDLYATPSNGRSSSLRFALEHRLCLRGLRPTTLELALASSLSSSGPSISRGGGLRSSGGGTRTHNLAINSRSRCHCATPDRATPETR